MKENYIMYNGKRIELTKEQIEKLGLKDCFSRSDKYYYISCMGQVEQNYDEYIKPDDACYNTANYCTDKSLLEQRALHETLSRLLWRFSMQNESDKIDWRPESDHCVEKNYICYDYYNKNFTVFLDKDMKCQGTIYFCTRETAQRAIDEIIIPFMKEHPEFVW